MACLLLFSSTYIPTDFASRISILINENIHIRTKTHVDAAFLFYRDGNSYIEAFSMFLFS